jgi:Alanine racemase, N-terminal domain
LSNDDKLIVAQQALLISRQNKGLGYLEDDVHPEEVARLDWNLLREDLSLPVAVLREERMLQNLRWMQQFMTAYDARLAPHGKTTMAPKLFELQVRSGAWGITLATAHQSLVAWRHGLHRVLMANQLVGKQNMALVSRMIADADFEYYCLVDSAESVHELGAFFSERGQRLHVLLEIGVAGGRGGVRNDQQLHAVLEAIAASQGGVVLAGVEIYEGILDNEAAVRSFLERAVAITKTLMAEGRFDRKPPIVSGAGSTWFDVVAEISPTRGFFSQLRLCCGQAVISRTMRASIVRPTPRFSSATLSRAKYSRSSNRHSRSGPTYSPFQRRHELLSESENAMHLSILGFRCRRCISGRANRVPNLRHRNGR